MTFPSGPSRPAPTPGDDLPRTIRVYVSGESPRVVDEPVLRGDSIVGLLDGSDIAWGTPLTDVVGVDHQGVDMPRTLLVSVVSAYIGIAIYSVVLYASGGLS